MIRATIDLKTWSVTKINFKQWLHLPLILKLVPITGSQFFPESEYRWSTITVTLENQWSTIGVPSEYNKNSIEVPSKYHWSTIGSPLAYQQYSINRSTTGVPLEYHQRTIGETSDYHRRTIGEKSENNRRTIGEPSENDRSTIRVESENNRNTMSEYHRSTIGVPSEFRRKTMQINYIFWSETRFYFVEYQALFFFHRKIEGLWWKVFFPGSPMTKTWIDRTYIFMHLILIWRKRNFRVFEFPGFNKLSVDFELKPAFNFSIYAFSESEINQGINVLEEPIQY